MFVRYGGDVSADGVAWTDPQIGSLTGLSDDLAVYGSSGWIYVYATSVSQTVGGSVPTITAGTKQGIVGESTQYQILSAGGATSYTALQLPPGMSLNTMTGIISGTPTSSGTYQVIVYGSNANGFGSSNSITFTITDPAAVELTGLFFSNRWAGGSSLNEIEYGGGWYVARESGANMWRTQDGVNWSSVQVGSGITLSELGYADGVWLAVASNKAVYRSIDNGASWTLAGTMPAAGGSLLKTGGVWLALNGTTVYRSSDNGSTWTRQKSK
jgi:hypothetical protein